MRIAIQLIPNLNGRTVFVLAVKGDKTTNPTIKYSFVSMEKLVDIYTAADTSITINGYKVSVATTVNLQLSAISRLSSTTLPLAIKGYSLAAREILYVFYHLYIKVHFLRIKIIN